MLFLDFNRKRFTCTSHPAIISNKFKEVLTASTVMHKKLRQHNCKNNIFGSVAQMLSTKLKSLRLVKSLSLTM